MSIIIMRITTEYKYGVYEVDALYISECDCEKTGLTPQDFYNKLKIAFPEQEGFTITCEASGENVPISFENTAFLQPAPVLLEATG